MSITDKDDKDGIILTGLGWVTLVVGIICLLVFSPVLTFLFAYLGGMLLDWIVGAKLVDGLNLMFNTTRFTRDLIPLTCATLATIGRYFKSSNTNNNSNKK